MPLGLNTEYGSWRLNSVYPSFNFKSLHILSLSHSTSHSIKPKPYSFFTPTSFSFYYHNQSQSSLLTNCSKLDSIDSQNEISGEPTFNPHDIDPNLLHKLLYDAFVWYSLYGLVVGDRNVQRSGIVPGVGTVRSPLSLAPVSFPESHWVQACDINSNF